MADDDEPPVVETSPQLRPTVSPVSAAIEDDERLRPGRIAVRGEQLRRLDEVFELLVAQLAGMPVSVPREKLLLDAQVMRKVVSVYADRAKASLAAVDHLRDFKVDVEGNRGEKVRVFCEWTRRGCAAVA